VLLFALLMKLAICAIDKAECALKYESRL